jgi:hypothetical protein
MKYCVILQVGEWYLLFSMQLGEQRDISKEEEMYNWHKKREVNLLLNVKTHCALKVPASQLLLNRCYRGGRIVPKKPDLSANFRSPISPHALLQ